jgi:hypothetical protein
MALSLTATNLFAQTGASAADAQSRTAVIASSFTKFKDVTKSKRGTTKSKYRRVETTAAVMANPAEYSGVYEDPDFGFGLKLTVDSRGAVSGSGYEPLNESVRRTFTLRSATIQGALLRATKVYANGETEPLEGAFMNRTSYESATDKGTTVFGFGALVKPVELHGMTINKVFYEKAR